MRRCSAPVCVISSEWFTGDLPGFLGAGRVRALARAAQREVRVVGYVRPQYAFLEGLYTEVVKMGYVGVPFDAYPKAVLHLPLFDYAAIFRPWRATFGTRFSVYPLEAARMPDGVVAHFLALLGARDLIPAAAALSRRNERIGAKVLEVLRLAGIPLRRKQLDHRSVRARLMLLRRKASAALAGDAPFRPLDATQVRTVTAHFADSNAGFAREYGVDDADVLFHEKEIDAAARPCRAGWPDFDAAERRRVRQLVHDVAGVELPADLGADDAPRQTRSGRPSIAVLPATPTPPTIVRIQRLGGRILSFARTMRRPGELVALLRWLAWEIEWRRARMAGARPSAEATAHRR